MNFKRQIRIVVEKTPKQETPASQQDLTLEGKAAVIGYYANQVVKKLGGMALTYVVVDTARQILVERAKRH